MSEDNAESDHNAFERAFGYAPPLDEEDEEEDEEQGAHDEHDADDVGDAEDERDEQGEKGENDASGDDKKPAAKERDA